MFQLNRLKKKMKPSGAFLKHGRVIIALDKVCYKIRKNIYSDGNSAKSTILRRFLTPNKFFILVHKIPKKGNAISIVQVLQKKNGPVFMARYLHFVGKPFLKKISRKYQVRSQFKIFLEKVPVQNSRKKIIKASLPKVFTNQESVAEMFEIDVNANNVEIEEHKLQRERENMKEQDTLIEAPELTDDSFLLPIKNEEEEEKIVALKTEFQNQCVICSEVFANAARLKTHHRYHVKREKLLKDVSSTVETKRQFRFRYYCPHWGCQKCYMSSSSAKYHARSHAEVVKENVKSLPTYFLFTNGLFKCRLCVEGFESIEKVRAHYLQCEGNVDPIVLTDSESQPLLIEMTTGRILRSRKCVKADITCKVCNQVCQSNYSYNRHIKIHDRPFKCLACFKSFDTSKQLNNHLQLHKITPIKLNSDTVENVDALLNVEISNEKIENNQTLNEKVSCKICRILVDDDEMLMVHRYEHMNYSCKLCGKLFMVPSQLARHEKIHERAFKCKKCHFSFDTTEKLEKHKETHSVDGNFKCNSCGSLFTTLKHMRVHQRNEQCMLQRNCKAEEFNNLNDLKVQLCEDGVKYVVEKVEKADDNKSNKISSVKKEIEKTHPKEENDLVVPSELRCKYCKKEFRKASNLKTHVRIHKRAFKCKECLISFDTLARKNQHVETHPKENGKFECRVCCEQFDKITRLRVHSYNDHSTTKKLRCKFKRCGKVFKFRYDLVNHKKSQHGQQQIEAPKRQQNNDCKLCGRSFWTETELQRHMSNLHEHKKEVIEKLKIQENIQIDKKICLSEENFKETQTNSLIKTEFEDPIETDENKTEIKEEKKSYIPKVLMQEIQSSKSSKSSADLCPSLPVSPGKTNVSYKSLNYSCLKCDKTFSHLNTLGAHQIFHL